jgi:hypothetical protein
MATKPLCIYTVRVIQQYTSRLNQRISAEEGLSREYIYSDEVALNTQFLCWDRDKFHLYR